MSGLLKRTVFLFFLQGVVLFAQIRLINMESLVIPEDAEMVFN